MEGFPFSADWVISDILHAETKPQPSGKGELMVRCPANPKKWFEVNLVKGKWNCFKNCSCCPVHHGGILDLYCLFVDSCPDRKAARKALMDAYYGNKRPSLERRRQSADLERMLKKEQSQLAPIEKRNEVYRALLDMLCLTKQHRADLLKRGLTDAQIARYGYKSVPQAGLKSIPKRLIAMGLTLDGVPGFYNSGRTWEMATTGSGYFIPYPDEHDNWQILQVRHDIMIPDNADEETVRKLKNLRYRPFTSSSYDGGCGAENVPYIGQLRGTTVCLTEGGLKAAVSESLSGQWFCAILGVKCFTAFDRLLDILMEMGVTRYIDAWDSDRTQNESVANDIKRLYAIAREKGVTIEPWNWNAKYKGCDDYLLAYNQRKKLTQKEKNLQFDSAI